MNKNKKGILIIALLLSLKGISAEAAASLYVNTPGGIATSGDFNADGFMDLVVVNSGYNTVTLLTGNGNGTFTPSATAIGTGSFPAAIATADLNLDGKLDLVTANMNGNTVSVILAATNGTFNTKVDYAVGNKPQSVLIGDFNGDGNPDIAALNDTTVSILLGTGTGSFGTQTTYNVGSGHGAYHLATGDLNNDGKLDLIALNTASSTVSVLIGGSNGTFSTQVTYQVGNGVRTTGGIGIADTNGDGKLDLVVLNSNDSTVSILTGTGMGTLNPQVGFGVADGDSSGGIAIADLRGAAVMDIITAHPGTQSLSVLLNNGNSTFQPTANYQVHGFPRSVLTGDFNGDGFIDLVAISSSDNVSVKLGTGTGVFYPKHLSLF